MHVFFSVETVPEHDDNYDGIDDTELNQCTEKHSENIENEPGKKNAQNPYYEGDFDTLAGHNDRSRTNLIIPDLNNTETVTSTQNVYYEIRLP